MHTNKSIHFLLILFTFACIFTGCGNNTGSDEKDEVLGDVTYYEDESGLRHMVVIQSPYQKKKHPFSEGKDPDIEELFFLKNYGPKEEDKFVGYWVGGLNQLVSRDTYRPAHTFEWQPEYAFDVIQITQNSTTGQYKLRIFSCEILETSNSFVQRILNEKKSPIKEAIRLQHHNGLQIYRGTFPTLEVEVDGNILRAKLLGNLGKVVLKYNEYNDTLELLELEYSRTDGQYNYSNFQLRNHNDILKRYSTEEDLFELADAMLQVKIDKIHENYPNLPDHINLMEQYKHDILINAQEKSTVQMPKLVLPKPQYPEGFTPPNKKDSSNELAKMSDITKERLSEDKLIGIWLSDVISYNQNSKETRPLNGMPYDLFTSKTLGFIIIDKRDGKYIVTFGEDEIRGLSKENKSYEKQLIEEKGSGYHFEGIFYRNNSVTISAPNTLILHDDSGYFIGYDKVKRTILRDAVLKYNEDDGKIRILKYEEYMDNEKLDSKDYVLGKGITEATTFSRYDAEGYKRLRDSFLDKLMLDAKRQDASRQ